jgi:hypothetical protein
MNDSGVNPRTSSVDTLATTILDSWIAAKQPTAYVAAVFKSREPILCNLIFKNELTSFKLLITYTKSSL